MINHIIPYRPKVVNTFSAFSKACPTFIKKQHFLLIKQEQKILQTTQKIPRKHLFARAGEPFVNSFPHHNHSSQPENHLPQFHTFRTDQKTGHIRRQNKSCSFFPSKSLLSLSSTGHAANTAFLSSAEQKHLSARTKNKNFPSLWEVPFSKRFRFL